MAIRSFGLVDEKCAEADFFLAQISRCVDVYATRYYFSAFASAARSITYSMQTVMAHIDGFEEWYEEKRKLLSQDPLARFFHAVRGEIIHIGSNPVSGGESFLDTDGTRQVRHFFERHSNNRAHCPIDDVEGACYQYLQLIFSIVLDCYGVFGCTIDPHQYYTSDNFEKLGKSIEDAEEEIFEEFFRQLGGFAHAVQSQIKKNTGEHSTPTLSFVDKLTRLKDGTSIGDRRDVPVRGWTKAPGIPEEVRWRILRDRIPGCGIEHLFEEYLGKRLPAPPEFKTPDLAGSTGEQTIDGWAYIPERLRKMDGGFDRAKWAVWIKQLPAQRDLPDG